MALQITLIFQRRTTEWSPRDDQRTWSCRARLLDDRTAMDSSYYRFRQHLDRVRRVWFGA